MFKDPRAGLMHAGIFWGFVLLTIGTADIVTGGVIQAVLSAPLDGAIWAADQRDAERGRAGRHRLDRLGVLRRLVIKPARLTLNRDALLILAMIGGARRERSCWPRASRSARYGDDPRRVRGQRRRRPAPLAGAQPLEVGFAVLWWLHIALVAAFLCYLPFSKHLHIATAFPNIFLRKLAPARRAAADGPRG